MNNKENKQEKAIKTWSMQDKQERIFIGLMICLVLSLLLLALVIHRNIEQKKIEAKTKSCNEQFLDLTRGYAISSLGWRTSEDERNAKFVFYYNLNDLERRCT